jgi:hypothetical protein
MASDEELSWLRFICVGILGLIVFIVYTELLTALFFGITTFELFLHLPDVLISFLWYYQIAVILIGISSIVAIRLRHRKIFYPLFVVIVCMVVVLADHL